MNVSIFSQKDYENKSNWTLGQNKPNSNPIKPNLRKAKMNINSFITKDYRKKDDFLVRINKPNSKPIPERPKMNVNLYVIEDYENKRHQRLEQNKPNSNPIKPNFRRDNPSLICSVPVRLGRINHLPWWAEYRVAFGTWPRASLPPGCCLLEAGSDMPPVDPTNRPSIA